MLRRTYPGVWVEQRDYFPDFIIPFRDRNIAFDIKYLKRPAPYHIFPILERCNKMADQYRRAGTISDFILSFIVTTQDAAGEVDKGVALSRTRLPINFTVRIYQISQFDHDFYPHLDLLYEQ